MNSRKLAILKTVHATIYASIVVAIFYVPYAAITKTYDTLLYIALGILIIEAIARFVSSMGCPLTTLAKYYGDPKGYVGSAYFSEKFSKYLFLFFSFVGVIALVILFLDIFKIR